MSKDFYRKFEDEYRGSRSLIKSRLMIYLQFINPFYSFEKKIVAIDFGCGRGEWIELLSEQGIEARGVDLDDGMLKACKELGLKTEKGDILSYIKSLKDSSCN